MSKLLPSSVSGVLFDLDGTFLDSAPDLYAALQEQCAEEGVASPAYAPVPEVVDSYRTEHVWIAAGAITLVGLAAAGALLLS